MAFKSCKWRTEFNTSQSADFLSEQSVDYKLEINPRVINEPGSLTMSMTFVVGRLLPCKFIQKKLNKLNRRNANYLDLTINFLNETNIHIYHEIVVKSTSILAPEFNKLRWLLLTNL